MISAAQFERRHSALSVNCKKVYAAVPIADTWSTSYILSEIQRVSSFTSNMRVLTGSLNQLKASGMVREPVAGLFTRTPIKQAADTPDEAPENAITSAAIEAPPATQKEKKTMPAIIVPPTPKAVPATKATRDPVAIFAGLAARCRQLADDFELAGLEVGEQMAQQGKEAEQLQQLRKLLGSMG